MRKIQQYLGKADICRLLKTANQIKRRVLFFKRSHFVEEPQTKLQRDLVFSENIMNLIEKKDGSKQTLNYVRRNNVTWRQIQFIKMA